MKLTGFDGKVALVTGAAGGIGAALVSLLHHSGSKVVAFDHDAEALQKIQQHVVFAQKLNVADSQAVDAAVAQVEREVGPIEIGVNVAGVLGTQLITETTDQGWREVFAVNCDGVFYVSRALARVMTPRRSGAIVTVSSNAAGIPRHSMAAYTASKAAATMFTRCLALELAPHGIRCNIVAPGSTLTPMQTGMWSDAQGAERVIQGFPEIFKTGIPLGKLATSEDVAQAVMFLLSEQAGHITMADLYVDGGATLRA